MKRKAMTDDNATLRVRPHSYQPSKAELEEKTVIRKPDGSVPTTPEELVRAARKGSTTPPVPQATAADFRAQSAFRPLSRRGPEALAARCRDQATAGRAMKISRRDFMDGVSCTALAVGVTSLGFYIADRQSLEPRPVRLATHLKAIGAGHVGFEGGLKGDLSGVVSLGTAPLEPRVVPGGSNEVLTT